MDANISALIDELFSASRSQVRDNRGRLAGSERRQSKSDAHEQRRGEAQARGGRRASGAEAAKRERDISRLGACNRFYTFHLMLAGWMRQQASCAETATEGRRVTSHGAGSERLPFARRAENVAAGHTHAQTDRDTQPVGCLVTDISPKRVHSAGAAR